MEKNLVEKFKLFIEKEQRLPRKEDYQAYKIYRSARHNNDLGYNVCNYYKLTEKEASEVLRLAKNYERNHAEELKNFIKKFGRLPRKYPKEEHRLYRIYLGAISWPEYNHKLHCKLTEEKAKEVLNVIKEMS